MAEYDGNAFAHQGLLQIAQHCAQAVLHAPQLTGKTDIKMVILTDNDLEEFLKLQAKSGKLGVRFNENIKMAHDLGEPPVLLLIGADVTCIVKAPCTAACPVGIDVPRYVRLIGDGKYNEAAAVIREKLPLASICGRLCHAPCEIKCRRGTLRDDPIAIRALKRFATDSATPDAKLNAPMGDTTGKRVAIIGSGPAGLTAAYYLRKVCGHAATIFEASSKPGGMMRVGVPEYRLPREVLDREIDIVRNVGVEIKLDAKIESIDALFQQGFDAIFVAIGAHHSFKLGIEGEDMSEVIEGLSFLRDMNSGKGAKVGKRVAVIGGGNVAIDVARTVKRLGAQEVTVMSLERQEEMPANRWEIEQAVKEGVKLMPSVGPTRIFGKKGRVTGLELRHCTSCFDDKGMFNPAFDDAQKKTIDADTVIVSIGQSPDLPPGFGLSLENGNRLHVDNFMLATERHGVYAGGDAVSGPASFIEAVAAGRKAASSIDQYLGGMGIIDEVLAPLETVPEVSPAALALHTAGDPGRAPIPFLPTEEALAGFAEAECGLSERTSLLETTRCLKCNEVGLDCGACGFKTCREAAINCQNRLNETGGEPWGWLMKGPSCIWRLMELGIAVDWAAAAAHRNNVESRVTMVPATAFMRMGYLPDCSMVLVLPLGPCKEHWYFDPGSGREDFKSAEVTRKGQMLAYPPLWMRFTGPGRDQGKRGMKTHDDWWNPPYERLDIVKDDEWGNASLERDYAIFAEADKVREKRKVKRLNLPKIKEVLEAKKKK